jgi:hypothetical protein
LPWKSHGKSTVRRWFPYQDIPRPREKEWPASMISDLLRGQPIILRESS